MGLRNYNTFIPHDSTCSPEQDVFEGYPWRRGQWGPRMAQTPRRVGAYVLTEAGTAFCKEKMAGAEARMGGDAGP